MPFDYGPYFSEKYFLRDKGLYMTKSDKVQQSNKVKNKAWDILKVISVDGLLIGLKSIK